MNYQLPVRSNSDLVTKVTFRGRKTGKVLVRYHTLQGNKVDLAEDLALRFYQLHNDIDRLIEIETKSREEWLTAGEDVGLPGTVRRP